MASTYTPIATVTLGSAAASYTFSSIPSTYTDLIVIGQSNGNVANINVRVNGDSGTNYCGTGLYGSGTTAFSSHDASATWFYATYTSGNVMQIINIMNYANTTTYKPIMSQSADITTPTQNGFYSEVGCWRSTAAINSVSLVGGSGNLLAGSTFTLYGITAA